MATLDERLSAAKRVGGKPSALREAISAEEAAASEMFSADSAAAALARARAARLAAHAVADEELKSVARSNSLERAQAARAAARAALAADAGPDDARESLGSSLAREELRRNSHAGIMESLPRAEVYGEHNSPLPPMPQALHSGSSGASRDTSREAKPPSAPTREAKHAPVCVDLVEDRVRSRCVAGLVLFSLFAPMVMLVAAGDLNVKW